MFSVPVNGCNYRGPLTLALCCFSGLSFYFIVPYILGEDQYNLVISLASQEIA